MIYSRFISTLVLAASFSSLAFNLHAQAVDTLDPALRTRIDSIAADVLKQTGAPSASVAIVKGGKIVYTHAYGKARLDPSVPATADMRYSIGSISKQFAATAISCCRSRAGSRSTMQSASMFPALRAAMKSPSAKSSRTPPVTRTMARGLPVASQLKPVTPQQILNEWATKPLDFEPGTQWQYSNTNYVIAGLIVEKVTGGKLFDFLERAHLSPAGNEKRMEQRREGASFR